MGDRVGNVAANAPGSFFLRIVENIFLGFEFVRCDAGLAVILSAKGKGILGPNSLLGKRRTDGELRLSGFHRAALRTSFEQLAQARLVKITYWRVPTWLDPFGMLLSQVVVNLLLELGDGVDAVADQQCFEPSLVRGEHNELDNQPGAL